MSSPVRVEECSSEFCRVLQCLELKPGVRFDDSISEALEANGIDKNSFTVTQELFAGTVVDLRGRTSCAVCAMVSNLMSPLQGNQDWRHATVHVAYLLNRFFFRVRDPAGATLAGLPLGDSLSILTDRSDISPSLARYVRNRRIDFDRVRHWFRLCDDLHKDVCPVKNGASPDRSDLPQSLRVVDLHMNCLANIPWTEQYVALSYVWGNSRPPLLLKTDLQALSEAGGLNSLQSVMPPTILDSMEVTRRIGLRYLWFDSLCLVQDDPAALSQSIDNMDIIYERAYVTIIAACNPSANGDLPGVSKDRDPGQMVCCVKPGLDMTLVSALDNHINRSIWASRGWTLQEHHLSRRTLTFVNNKVYFRCRYRNWNEESWSDIRPQQHDFDIAHTSIIALIKEAMDEDAYEYAPYDFLFDMIAIYQRRQLSEQSDAINAMAGMMRRVSEKSNTDFLEGLPTSILPLALLFYHFEADQKASSQSKRRDMFPTYSWAGRTGTLSWNGVSAMFDTVKHPQDLQEWLDFGNWIRWYVYRDGKGQEAILHQGSLGLPPQGSTLMDTTLVFGTPPNADDQWKACIDPRAMKQEVPHLPKEARPYPILCCTTYTVHLHSEPDSQTTLGSHHDALRLHLQDTRGLRCGTVDLDIRPTGISSNTIVELAILSISIDTYRELELKHPGTTMDEQRQLRVTTDEYWAMLIEPVGSLYERRGIGKVSHAALMFPFSPGLCWKEIHLA